MRRVGGWGICRLPACMSCRQGTFLSGRLAKRSIGGSKRGCLLESPVELYSGRGVDQILKGKSTNAFRDARERDYIHFSTKAVPDTF